MYDCETCGQKHWSLNAYATCHKMTDKQLERLAFLAAGEYSGILLAQLRDLGLYGGQCYSGAVPRQWANAL